MSAPDSQSLPEGTRDRVWWALLGAALLTRLVWVMWLHPPQDHVFSDMAHYLHRARLAAALETRAGMREMVWQAWGTHALLAIPFALLGPGRAALELAALAWAACSAATVVLGYELAHRVLPRAERSPLALHAPALAVGLVLLLWFPLLSHAGFFISETPYTLALLASTLAITRALSTGEGTLAAGAWAALAWVLRPQCAVFFVALSLVWLYARRRRAPWTARLDARAARRFAIPLLLALALSSLRFFHFSGAPGLMAESAAMNLTAGRCHNIVTRSFSTESERRAAAGDPDAVADRRVSLPGFRALDRRGPEHPLALRPALGAEHIDIVGNIGDAGPYRELRRRCYAATGLGGQLRYAVTNVALLWVIARPWPESSDQAAPRLLPVAVRARDIAAGLAPLALLGMLLGLRGLRSESRGSEVETEAEREAKPEVEVERRAGLFLCALQLSSLLLVAALFFGTPRLRVPYDPYALILVAALGAEVLAWIRARR